MRASSLRKMKVFEPLPAESLESEDAQNVKASRLRISTSVPKREIGSGKDILCFSELGNWAGLAVGGSVSSCMEPGASGTVCT